MRADAARYFENKKRLEQRRLKWDLRFLNLAEVIAKWSKDPSTQVGAVITDGNRIVSVGYNGFPKGMKDDERLEERGQKYPRIVHGEINAIHFANRSVKGCTLYTVPFMPCSNCASQIAQVEIKRVVTFVNDNPRWQESFKVTEQTFKECGIELTLYEKEG